MILIALLGFFISKKFRFGQVEQKFVSKIFIFLINPFLIIHQFDMEFSSDKLAALGVVFGLSVVIHLVMLAVALIFVRSKSEEGKALDCIDRLSVVFTNCGFIGIPLISGVFPDGNGVLYLLSFIAAFNIFLWTAGYFLVSGKINLIKLVTNPNILAVVFGIVIFCMPFRLPFVVSKTVELVSSMNTAMAMFLLGMLFANFKGFKASYINRIIRLCILRHVVVMIVVLGIVFVAFRFMGSVSDIRLMCFVVYIAALCPVGMSVSSFAVLFDKDESYSGLAVLATSAVSVVMLPAGVALAELIL
ncbi:MAG: AEC family transporter [Treponema sp.]|nr:AEC family transporter [Treponema sp.]